MNELPPLQLITDSGLFVLIWLVQLIIYPSFTYTEKKCFNSWHRKYTGLMGLIVSPLMLTQVGIEVLLLPDEMHRVRILLIGLVWLATFSLSVPCHHKLHREGYNDVTIRHLIATNWIRTLLWSFLFLETVFTVFY
ncbi:MAG: hypothetical protein KKD01_05125 [Proteobacteria bacterium]|nr:hypothetical protein [Pseudomonadota bacterium]MBU1138773.1 hypothetical protein [Pseudomonadota bacterium]MBU1232030.1 hypothetical protein [Pseudomonadota bacterium]MBU1418056.1 hypothetical protein [Pseudomonadota bacterium]MBU1454092.1 hypothetical protein [Pseudomonadota bacterium]